MFEKTITKEVVYRDASLRLSDMRWRSVRGIRRYAKLSYTAQRLPDCRARRWRFVFIKQFRKAQEQVCLEIVAGNCEPDEDHAEAAMARVERRPLSGRGSASVGTMRPR